MDQTEQKKDAATKIDDLLKKRRDNMTFFKMLSAVFKLSYKFIRQLLRLETIKKMGNIQTERLTQKEHLPTEKARPYEDN